MSWRFNFSVRWRYKLEIERREEGRKRRRRWEEVNIKMN